MAPSAGSENFNSGDMFVVLLEFVVSVEDVVDPVTVFAVEVCS